MSTEQRGAHGADERAEAVAADPAAESERVAASRLRDDVIAARGPAHVKRGSVGRHRLRPADEQQAIRTLAATSPVHPETLPMTTIAEAAIVANTLLDDLDSGASSDAGDDERLDGGRRRPKQTFLGLVREAVVIAVIAIVIAMVVKAFLVRPYYIPSASMEQTLMVGDRLIVNLLVPDVVPVARGDVVVFTDPGGWLPSRPAPEKSPLQAIVDGALEAVGLKPSDANDSLIKRVIGLPGDHVVCCNAFGQLVVNDVAISEPYVQLAGNTAVSGMPFDVTVPADRLWVMGDNRYNSEDSRYHQDDADRGFVPLENVVGRAILINWPADRFGVLGNYPEVFAQVPSREPQAAG